MSAQAIDYYATGKRKTAIARVHLRPGTGEIHLNDKSMDDYFGGHEALKMLAKQPFAVTETCWPAEDVTPPYPTLIRASEQTQRVVSENSKTLKFKASGFERE